jgi:pimeloyl-ACP methyl ester carboxylesterase
MPILVGIDGTDDSWVLNEARNARYDKAFAKSFVSTLCKKKGNAKYFRGPLADGGYLWQSINEGAAFIVEKKRIKKDEPVLLTGYSRGALAAICVAKKLKEEKIKVKALMMFDCVDRDMANDAEVVPDNVENVCHVIRNPAARSRATFGNDGMKYFPNSTKYLTPTMFMCTHGGMGGVPWEMKKGGDPNEFIDEGAAEAWFSPVRNGPVWKYRTNVTYAQDVEVSKDVWAHVQSFLRTHGYFSVT